jgi:LytS/YehU family sensor histidine kinase
MQLEQIRFERCFQFTIDTGDIDAASVEVPPLIIQPFVENSILHGLLPLKEEGSLTIRIYQEGNELHIDIADNGIGRKAASDIKNQSGFKRQSHGMEITLKRIELFNKENGLLKQVKITDLYKEDGRPAGTSVAIPLAYSETF